MILLLNMIISLHLYHILLYLPLLLYSRVCFFFGFFQEGWGVKFNGFKHFCGKHFVVSCSLGFREYSIVVKLLAYYILLPTYYFYVSNLPDRAEFQTNLFSGNLP